MRFSSYGPLIIVLNNNDYNIDQNNRDYDFVHNQALGKISNQVAY